MSPKDWMRAAEQVERTVSHLVVRCTVYGVRCQGCRADWVRVWRRPSRHVGDPQYVFNPLAIGRGLMARPVRSKRVQQVFKSNDFETTMWRA